MSAVTNYTVTITEAELDMCEGNPWHAISDKAEDQGLIRHISDWELQEADERYLIAIRSARLGERKLRTVPDDLNRVFLRYEQTGQCEAFTCDLSFLFR